MKLTLLFLLFIGVLPSCGRSSKKQFRNESRKSKLHFANTSKFCPVALQEAKLIDIQIPISSTPNPECFNDSENSTMLGYSDKTLSPEQVETFFFQEMERGGWQAEEIFRGYETMMRFSKPNRSCMISIRKGAGKAFSQFLIGTCVKEELH